MNQCPNDPTHLLNMRLDDSRCTVAVCNACMCDAISVTEQREMNERVRRGFYRHYASDDPYFVVSVSIRDEHGHGNVDAPRDVIYESTRSVESGLPNSRTEAEFTELVKWPDGVMRPRFIRVKP